MTKGYDAISTVVAGIAVTSVPGIENAVGLADKFHTVVNCIGYTSPPYEKSIRGLEKITFPFEDAAVTLPKHRVRWLLAHLSGLLNNGQSVLLHCAAGQNRSAFLAALLLIEWMGLHPEAAIAIVREARPGGLNNDHFVKLIRMGYYSE